MTESFPMRERGLKRWKPLRSWCGQMSLPSLERLRVNSTMRPQCRQWASSRVPVGEALASIHPEEADRIGCSFFFAAALRGIRAREEETRAPALSKCAP